MKERETKLLYDGISGISDKYIEEAGAAERRKIAPAWTKWGAVAACLTLIAAAAFMIMPKPTASAIPTDASRTDAPSTPAVIEPSEGPGIPADIEPSTPEALHISLGSLVFNELEAPSPDGALLWYDPELYDRVWWDRGEITDYFGTDLTPAYIPDGLDFTGYSAEVILDKAGEVVMDNVHLIYRVSYPEPRELLDIIAPEGFTLTASKLGIINDCLYITPEDEIVTSDILGIQVTLGHRDMPYGPYDPETHAPAGTYELYTASFELCGVSCELVANRMTREEFVKVVASLICGEETVIDP